MTDFMTARRNMVENQLRPAAITDARLLAAAGAVKREVFLPKEAMALAYGETAIGIGPGRYMLTPLCSGVLLQAAEIKAGDVVLIVGAGDGYLAALAARLAVTVIGLESDPGLAARAADKLTGCGVDNFAMIGGDLAGGCARQAPYDVIVLNGAAETGVGHLLAQLRDGGRLACVEYENGVGRARLYRRDGENAAGRTVRDLAAPVLPGFEKAAAFSFG
ncbi:MAG: protein-L-isoaspartate O-methyltransferase [Alphaproteobacteria bacterium]